MPKISVIMPVYNAAPFLRESIESILNQTYKDFEFLIFNDGSTDNSTEIIESYKDPRIKFFNSEKNYGYVKHLNEGIKLAQGEYIARMDADDISLNKRFEKQVLFLDNNKEYGICGTGIWQFYSKAKKQQYLLPITHEDIQLEQFFNCSFIHPTVMIRNKILSTNGLAYDENDMPAEDYNLWAKILDYTKGYNLPESLLYYRRHKNQTSNDSTLRTEKANKARIKYLSKLVTEIDNKQATKHTFLLTSNWVQNIDYINKAFNWFEFLIKKNYKLQVYNDEKFNYEISKRIFYKCYAITNSNFDAISYYKSSDFINYFIPPKRMIMKAFIKKLLRT